MNRFLDWAPRILCIAFALFLSIFALDVFTLPLSPAEKALALLMHLVPSFVVVAALALVWRREWIGAVLFPLLAGVHLLSKWGQLHWTAYAIIDGPLLLLAVLFWMNWRSRSGSVASA